MLFLIPVIQTFNHADNSAGRDHDCFGVIRVISYILRIRERAFSRHINLSIHTYLLYHMNTYDASKKELIFLYFLKKNRFLRIPETNLDFQEGGLGGIHTKESEA